jgi:hypothetical protein
MANIMMSSNYTIAQAAVFLASTVILVLQILSRNTRENKADRQG